MEKEVWKNVCFVKKNRNFWNTVVWQRHTKIYNQKEWVVVKNYQEFTRWILKNGIPATISFDHDLADEHYDIGCACGWSNDYPEQFDEKTGLDCAKWLVDYYIDNNINPKDFPNFYVHSMNPVGAERIKNYLNSYLDNN